MKNLKQYTIKKLADRDVELEDIAKMVYRLQEPYTEELNMEECVDSILHVLDKREVQYTLLTGIVLDEMTEKEMIEEPLASIIKKDEPLYGVDETLAIAIANIYGTVGFTSFGYLDKKKMGIMKKLDTKGGNVNTFLDDLVAGVAAGGSARIAHQKETEKNGK